MNTLLASRDLVLLGGGHSHALALRMLAMRAPSGTRLTLVSESGFAPYSGMLPGLVAGHYEFADTHIDLRRLCGSLGVRFIEAAATGIDYRQQLLQLSGRPALPYDLLSINVGAQPDLDSVPGARDYAVPVKPVSNFYQRWLSLQQRLSQADAESVDIVVVGGGAGSVELALAMRQRLGASARLQLLCGGQLLEAYNAGAVAAVRRACARLGVEVLEQCRVAAVERGVLRLADGASLVYGELVWCTGVVAASWLAASGLPCDEKGFLQVEDTLQVPGLTTVFGAGDAALQTNNPRPRAGVFAVRQAPVLARNLLAALRGTALRAHTPQRRFLSLLSLGARQAVADRGPLYASGAWVWRWKDRIDRRFMARFSELPTAMAAPAELADDAMAAQRCGGCGAKIPALTLRAVLQELALEYPAAVAATQLQEDAAVIDWPSGQALVQSVDTLRSLLDDPWVMGRIAVLHALSDIYAMGAEPHSVLAHLSLPYAAPAIQQRELRQLMSGVLHELQQAQCQLVGGHSMEGPELAIGITANGTLAAGAALSKSPTAAGQQLVLTKPLGTGVIFAAAMENSSPGEALAAALASMLHSNRGAAAIARQHGVVAATDITGFGLLGHLLEMVRGSELEIELDPALVPTLAGAAVLLQQGFRSTLHAANVAALAGEIDELEEIASALPLLFDPQTSGGLVLAVAEAGAPSLVAALRAADYPAASIGATRQRSGAGSISIRR